MPEIKKQFPLKLIGHLLVFRHFLKSNQIQMHGNIKVLKTTHRLIKLYDSI